MNPLLLAALFSAAPGLISMLFGGGQARGKKETAELRRIILGLSDPRDLTGTVDERGVYLGGQGTLGPRGGVDLPRFPNLGTLVRQLYPQVLASPAYAQAQRGIATGGNVARGDLSRALASRGIGTSGIGAITSAAIPSMVGGQMGNLNVQAHQAAQSQAEAAIARQIAGLLGTQPPTGPSPSAQLFAGGLEAFGPIFQAWLGAKYPNLFSFTAPGYSGRPSFGMTTPRVPAMP